MSAFTPNGNQVALIRAGVANLKEFGYPAVTKDNILTDLIFRAFFRSMLEDNKGKGHDKHIQPLIDYIDSQKEDRS